MNLIARIPATFAAVVVFLFSVYGFVATFEPFEPSQQLTWRIVYGMLGAGALLAVLAINRRARNKST